MTMVSQTPASSPGPELGAKLGQRRRYLLMVTAMASLLGGCSLGPVRALIEQGHAVTVECLHAERAQTDGDELRCEEWSYVYKNYLDSARR